MRLAGFLGRTVRELEEGMDSAELSRWMAYDNEYGIPDGYFVVGQICTVMARIWGSKKAGPADFVPYFRPPRKPMTAGEMMGVLDRFEARRG